MNYQERHACCFFGHRYIKKTDKLVAQLYETIQNLIVNHDVYIFLFGSKSKFNELCYSVVTELKHIYPNIVRIYVRAEFPIISEDYKNYLLQSYEETYFPKEIVHSGKAVYVGRNQNMINNSFFCIIYYDDKYSPDVTKNSSFEYQPKSGTKLAYDYAIKKGKKIINVLNPT